MLKNTIIVLVILVLAEWSLLYRRRHAAQRKADAKALRERLDKLMAPREPEYFERAKHKPRRRRGKA